MRARTYLVVNADDFAWSRSVNRGIVEAHERGIVTRASILATGSAFEDACALASATPSLGIGVHLSFYRGATILPPEQVSTLLGEDGRLTGSWREIVRRLVAGSLDFRQLDAELRAQIERVRQAGLEPAHLDSEKHLHQWPSVFDLVCRIAQDTGIRQVRLVREPFALKAVPIGLGLLSRRNVRTALACGITVPDATLGVTRRPKDVATFERILRGVPAGRVEFVVHPGHVDAEFMAMQATVANRLVCSREEELATLLDPAARAAIERSGCMLLEGTGEVPQ